MGGDIRAAAVAAERVAAALEPQPALFELAGLPSTVHLQALRERRGPGRPPGARNRRSEDVARWVIEHLGDPLVTQAAIAVTPVEELVAAGLTVAEAFAERRQSAAMVLAYLHKRQPLAVDVSRRQVVHLTIVEGEAAPGGGDGDGAGSLIDAEENQWVDSGVGDAL